MGSQTVGGRSGRSGRGAGRGLVRRWSHLRAGSDGRWRGDRRSEDGGDFPSLATPLLRSGSGMSVGLAAEVNLVS
jgi:hypothetical protein